MIGIFDYTTLFTFLGTLCGILSIIFLCPVLFYIVIMLDGLWTFRFFRWHDCKDKKNRSDFAKRYGVQLDSLSDVFALGRRLYLLALRF